MGRGQQPSRTSFSVEAGPFARLSSRKPVLAEDSPHTKRGESGTPLELRSLRRIHAVSYPSYVSLEMWASPAQYRVSTTHPYHVIIFIHRVVVIAARTRTRSLRFRAEAAPQLNHHHVVTRHHHHHRRRLAASSPASTRRHNMYSLRLPGRRWRADRGKTPVTPRPITAQDLANRGVGSPASSGTAAAGTAKQAASEE